MASESLGAVLVLGLGVSGKSVAKYCANLLGDRVSSLFIAAGAKNADSEAFVESLAGPGVDYAFGDDALERFAGQGCVFDLCVASPGIPYWHELYATALELSGEVISEVELAWRESDPESLWVAITGTNGKTTTTACCAEVLRACGFAADAVGNIGDVCLDAVAAGKTKVYVAELSSYQLYSTKYFAADVAVMLNITPDHVHWHKTLEAYRDAKFKLLDNMMAANLPTAGNLGGDGAGTPPTDPAEAPARRCGEAAVELAPSALRQSSLPLRLRSSQPRRGRSGASPRRLRQGFQPSDESGAGCFGRVAVLDATNDVVRAKVRELKALSDKERGFDYIPLGTADGLEGDMRAKCGARNAAFIDAEGMLRVAYNGCEHAVLPAAELQIKGRHNASNALVVAAVAVALGADDQEIADALRAFAPLEHRIEPCGFVGGVACYNDSKATNVDATVKALEAFPGQRVVVLLGGDDKGTDLTEVVRASFAHTCAAVCFGAAGERFARAFEESLELAPEGFEVLRAHHLADALDAGLSVAHAGDVVLLSPACASFDEFKSFEHRGSVFKQLVQERADRVGDASESGYSEG